MGFGLVCFFSFAFLLLGRIKLAGTVQLIFYPSSGSLFLGY